MDKVLRIDRWPAGTVDIPPSKSLSHRALLCAALAEGESVLHRIDLAGDDVAATAACLRALGAELDPRGATLRVTGGIAGTGRVVLDCGESGSTLRFLLPLVLLSGRPAVLTGRGRLLERPMEPYLEALRSNGAQVRAAGGPIETAGGLAAGIYELPGDVSSQYVTGLLLALPLTEGESRIRLTTPLESAAYVDLTIDVMRAFGVTVESLPDGYRVPGGQRYQSAEYTVEGDYSGAAFFLAAGALGRSVGCRGLSNPSRQGDRAILDILASAGAIVEEVPGLGLQARAERLRSVTVDVSGCPDLAPPVAALLCCAEGESRILGAARLRLKESDRLATLAGQLGNLGADIREDGDTLVIRGKPFLTGGTVDPHRDHRIAMAAAVASIRCLGPVEIRDPDCVRKSYPGFWDDFCRTAKEETK